MSTPLPGPTAAAPRPAAPPGRGAALHRLANPGRFLRLTDRWLPWLWALAGLVLGAGAAWALVFSPPDWQQGETVRIMYVHVPMAWLAMGGALAGSPAAGEPLAAARATPPAATSSSMKE